LCAPLTKWNSTSGLSTASQSARSAGTPQCAASRGTYRTSSTTPTSAISRMPSTVGTVWSPDRSTTQRASCRKAGPYGVGVCDQMPGTSAR
jgi:hypothetical protein